MAGTRGSRRPGVSMAAEPAEPPAMAALHVPDTDASVSESQISRAGLRQRWELASVLNFLHVFKQLVGGDLKISAEELETALITPNADLAQIHISLLKGIPPAVRNLMDTNAWITVASKKLATWWPWVAEGENPLKADHGKEISRYRELDPTTRLLILKALCEVRALQDDILSYITDALKNGTPITAFRKERIGGDDDGNTYWYDGDPVVGYRLYREITRVESKQKLKGKGCLAEPTIESRWETLATNLEEFRKISDNLLSSKNTAEAAVGEIVQTDIIPVLEEHQKKKERALKRQQTQSLLLNGFLNSSEIGPRHSRRERKPVKYTFDEYDQSIEEAIQITTKSKTTDSVKDRDKKVEQGVGHEDAVLNENMDSDKENSTPADHGSPPQGDDDGKHGDRVSDDDDDDDYDDKDGSNGDDGNGNDSHSDSGDDGDGNDSQSDNGDDDDGNDSLSDFDKEVLSRSAHAARGKKGVKAKEVAGSTFHGDAKGHAEMKKRLRQRPTRNTDYSDNVISDSEDE